ncbi:CO-responsive transcriptional regulator RcoM [Rhodospirillum rubrum]|uniref:CO-responsive transcriptional regulator RcoM n=1 Tax=Rhodospirillum rubrum (strain ATCC 11170 / ATH 1.1.1 / DSM 467 / LMG 4362 / NCIMB 8255 / S1) TaxID=269796 RepID=RCOM_RHORT|nr:CO-responsive transcriptional regulator RcoM [Rhodospirillum rubrum]Q2RNI6.1 RecName: Full=CO-responsive transcriptional regulator RcoM [Rhodospirillum rubrum ATCC 11170]ABC24309.1 transcriptional regulator, LytR/AlgR family [Rhodospirillum rubrum ATCC 11170]AEO50060.1 LytR/AlgR family transcriptional regulator [Rhodospirillum rubrum F11]MBK5956028.1 CO-responsive transcriptional regulator RcoM [Rhodospirillum rubrum]QXG80236.1 PAS domain-containing transcriptional regulator [Rhodospirillum
MDDFAYNLRRAETGVLLLADDLTVTAVSPGALSLLGLDKPGALLGRPILDLHPPPLRPKVAVLLKTARGPSGPAATAVLSLRGGPVLIRASALTGQGETAFALVLTAVGESRETKEGPSARPAPPGYLRKVPLGLGETTEFVDTAGVIYLEADGHYSRVHTAFGHSFCPLALAELERRLDPDQFLRVHRSYIVALAHVRAFRKRESGGLLVMDTGAGDLVPIGRAQVTRLRGLLAI